MKNMKTVEELKTILTAHKKELREKYAVREIGFFGSYVQGEQKKKSDVDVLVEFEESANISLLDFIGFENYLSEILGVKVDL